MSRHCWLRLRVHHWVFIGEFGTNGVLYSWSRYQCSKCGALRDEGPGEVEIR